MSFAQDVDKFMLEVETLHTENVEAVEDYVYNQIRAKSPVDSGAYKANHNRSNDSPDYSWSPNKTSGQAPAPTGGKFPAFFVATGCPYAGALENGHSTQHPSPNYGLAYASAKAKFGL